MCHRAIGQAMVRVTACGAHVNSELDTAGRRRIAVADPLGRIFGVFDERAKANIPQPAHFVSVIHDFWHILQG